jgi:uncharacterized protein
VRTLRPFLIWLLALFALSASAAKAELPPRPQGPVADLAAIIPDAEEAALDARLRAYNRDTGRAIIVATVPSLDGQVIERYAQDLARSWQIGGAESQEGVLVLVAPTERKLRIHAAVGAQGRLTDGLASRIIRETMTPRFKAEDYGGGIAAGVEQIIAQLDRDEVDAQAVAEAAEAARSSAGQGSGGGAGSVIFWLFLIVVFMVIFSRRRRGFRRSGIDPGIILWGVSEVLHHATRGGGGGGGFGGGDSGGGFGGFGGGGGGFDGGGASGDW